jgi:hypothetical protein
LSIAHEQELLRRGLSLEQIAELRDDLQYRSLERGGRARAVAKLIEAGLEEHLPSVPGFVIKELEDARPYWTLAGPPGLVIPVHDDKGRIVAIQIIWCDFHANTPAHFGVARLSVRCINACDPCLQLIPSVGRKRFRPHANMAHMFQVLNQMRASS